MRNSLHSSFSQGRNLPCSSDQANTARAAKLEPFSVQVFYSPDKAGQTAVNFIVDDLDKDLAGLASKGITATEPQEVSQGRQRLATIADPDGNQLSLIEQCSEAAEEECTGGGQTEFDEEDGRRSLMWPTIFFSQQP